MTTKPRLLILMPIGRYQEPLNRESLDKLAASGMFDLYYLTIVGMSEVSRARNMLCYRAWEYMQNAEVDAVFWVDSDMVFWPETVMMHYQLLQLGVFGAISGAYANRHDNRLAASVSLQQTKPKTVDYHDRSYTFTPVMAGMGCLMLNPVAFKVYLESCLRNDTQKEIFACYPTIERHRSEDVMVSEDFNFCRKLYDKTQTMVYLCRDLQYGHIAQKVIVPMLEDIGAPKPSDKEQTS